MLVGRVFYYWLDLVLSFADCVLLLVDRVYCCWLACVFLLASRVYFDDWPCVLLFGRLYCCWLFVCIVVVDLCVFVGWPCVLLLVARLYFC